MPTVTITAFDARRLPSPLRLQSWRDDWGAANFAAPVINDNVATYAVAGLTVQQTEEIVEPTIDEYNETHHGNDTIVADVSA